MADNTSDDQDQYLTTPEEAIDVDNVSPEERRAQLHQQEGREVDSLPRPSNDGDDADDEDDREV